MGNKLIADRVFRLKYGETIKLKGIEQEITFINGEEFHIVSGLLYMRGYPLPGNLQKPILEWIMSNPTKFVGDNRVW